MSVSLHSWRWSVARSVRLALKTSCTEVSRRLQSTGIFPSKIFKVSEEVAEAVYRENPVVALETTIYTHGFPYPDNVALASHLESVVRENGGVPATIGVLHGIARVGMNPEELVELASYAGRKGTMKVSRRDLPYITGLGISGEKINGGTTIAGTMILAHLAGIEIFGTGGLGGVHRGGEHSMDISADLTELGRTPVAVISSGCKSFLDIPRTLEYLETQGVSVATFLDGRTGNVDLPAFWTRASGITSPSVVQNEKEAAAIIYARKLLNIQSGLFFANPIPAEHSIPKAEIDLAIEEAVHDAQQRGVHGHANTPFILSRIKELTKGKSIFANRALIESNVARATKVAVELSALKLASSKIDQCVLPTIYGDVRSPRLNDDNSPETTEQSEGKAVAITSSFQPSSVTQADILVAGSIAVDQSCDYAPTRADSPPKPLSHTSNPAVISQAIGGVGHNVATAAHLIGKGLSVRLCSVVADDLAGKMILSSLKDRGLDSTAIKVLEGGYTAGTAQYIAINDIKKDLVMAMADMRILGSANHDFSEWKSIIKATSPKWIVVDSNWDEALMFQWIKEAKAAGVKVAFEPVSVAKSTKLFPPSIDNSSNRGVYPLHNVDLGTPNEQELMGLHDAAKANSYFEGPDWWTVIDGLGISSTGTGPQLQQLTSSKLIDKGIPQRMIQLLPFIPTIVTKLGAEGVVLAMLLPTDHPMLQSPASAPYILSRNMSGDPNIGGIYMRLLPPAELVGGQDVVSVNGVGDTFLGVLVAGLAKGLEIEGNLINVAQRAAVMTLKSKEAVSSDLSILAAEL